MSAPVALLVLWGGSAYDSLRALLRLAGGELEGLGYRVEDVTLGAPDGAARLQTLLRAGGVAFALGMSGVGSDLQAADGRLLWEAAGVPFFDSCCDHPCYVPARHRMRNRFLIHGYVFPDHAAYAARHLGAGAEAFAVHMGLPDRALFPGAPLPLAEREPRLVFVKGGADPERILDRWAALPQPFRALLPAAAEELTAQGATADVLPTLQRLGAPEGLFLDGGGDLALGLVREVDAYVRFRRADLVLRALKPYPVDVYGTGWDHIDWSGGRRAYRGAVDFAGMTALLQRHLGSVSINPLVDGSMHDRVAFALAAGVVPVGDANAFWRTRLPDLAPYGFEFSRGSVAAAVEALLDDPGLAVERAEAARRALGPSLSLRASLRRIADLATFRLP